MAVIAVMPAERYSLAAYWLRCIACKAPHLKIGSRVTPGRHAMPQPEGLPEDVAAAWVEAQECYSAGAYTATVMICRKLVFHVTVEAGLPAKDARDRAPSFREALDHLEAGGVFTGAMRPWVQSIVEIGHEANHELPQTTPDTALQILAFLRQLLVLQYEMPHKMRAVGVEPDATESD